MQPGEVGDLLEALEGFADARQVFLQIEAGRVEQELVVLVRLHVFAVEILVGLVVAHAVPRPLQLLVADRFQGWPAGDGEHGGARRVGLEFEDCPLGDLLRLLVVVHQLPIADAAITGEPEGRHHGGRHAVGLPQGDAIHDALPARVIGGLRFGRLGVGLRRVHAAIPAQPLHSVTASTAFVPKASAPV